MCLKSRIERLEKKLPKDDLKINVTYSSGGCPSPEEKARIRAADPDNEYIWICNCPNCRGDNGR